MCLYLFRLCEVQGFHQTVEIAIKHQCIYCIPAYVTKTKVIWDCHIFPSNDTSYVVFQQMSQEAFASLRGQRPEETELVYFQRMSSFLRLWLVFLICRKSQVFGIFSVW